MNAVRSAGGSGDRNNYKPEYEAKIMWQAFESSIQTLNRARRLNQSLKKSSKNAAGTQSIIRPASSINELMRKTNFSKEEIRHFYRSFKQDCPSGEVTKTHFSSVISALFPSGEYYRYSSFLFQNIDRANTGHIRFEDLLLTLAILMRGSIEDRLGWIFDLYDLNKDGILTRAELLQTVTSIYHLIAPVSKLNLTAMTNTIEERTDELFQNWDTKGNGRVSKEDFVRYCLQDEAIRRSIEMFK